MAVKKSPPGSPEPGEGTPGAQDGNPDENELARRRAAKSGASISDRASDDAGQSGDELFPLGKLEGDPKVTLKNLIKAGAAVKVRASLSSAEVPITGNGLFDPEDEIKLLVSALPGGVTPRPTHGGEKGDAHRPVKEWTLSQSITVTHVQDAGEMFSREQVQRMLDEAGVPAATVSKLLGDAPQAAGGTA